MDPKDRITKMAQLEFPGCNVVFDEVGHMFRFRIEDSSGRMLSKVSPHYLPSEVEDWTEDKLRAVIRGVCGF